MTLVRRVALMVVPFVLGIAAPAHGMWNCSTGSAVTDPASNPDLVADCEVLLAANREWGGTLNWSAQRPISEWKGVTVSGTPSRVTKLILNDSELSGSIPAELGNLSNLAQLDLYRNDLSGSIPRALGSLSNLTILRLYSNELTGSIPRELGNLSNLNYLNLSYNQLTGYIPWELRRLTNLTRFGVHYNSLQGSIPYWIGNLTNLTLLYLGRSGLSGSMPSWLGNLTRLQHLYLAALGLTGRVPSELGSLTNLSHLWLNGNDLSGCVPSSLYGGLLSYNLGDLEFCDEPGKPVPPELTDPSGRTLQVGWSPPSNTGPRISGYDLEYRREGSSGSYTLRSYGWTTRSTTITGLAPFTSYEVRVRARNADGPGPWSDLSTASTTTVEPPLRMRQPEVTASSGHTLRVVWRAPSNTGPAISGYDVEYRKRGSVSSTRRSFGRTARSTTITGLESNTTYEVQVRAKNADGAGQWSPADRATTPRVPPGKPAPPEVMPAGWRSLTVKWSAPSNTGPAISDYDVWYREEGSGPDFTDAGFDGTARETTITRLRNGTRYEVQVRARNADGTGAWSDPGVGKAGPAVDYGAASYTASEGGSSAAVTITLNDAAVEAVTIPITVTAGAATEDDDYTVSGLSHDESVTFVVGESSKTLTVTAHEDDDSADETVELGFGTLPDAVSAGMRPTAVVALSDNDPLTVTLSGPEGPVGGPFEVAVTFSEEVTGFDAADVTVVGGTATVSGSGARYKAAVAPTGWATVTVDVGAGVIQDDEGNDNRAAERYSVSVHYTCSSGIVVADPANNGGLVEDCETLLEAKAELAGTGSLNWRAGVAMSLWQGLTIDGTPPRVTAVQIGGRGLTGRIPASLSNLSRLRRLRLDNNELTGSILSELGSLADLTVLRVSDNELSGNIPSELGDLTNLLVLYLHNNRLSGCVPASLRPRLLAYELGDLRFCDQGPGKPEAPTVTPAGGGLRVSWSEPVNRGAAISDYDVQYREEGSEGEFTDAGFSGTARETRITGLPTDTSYEVQLRATSADGTSGWSESGVGATVTVTVGFGSRSYTAVEDGSGVPVTVALSEAAVAAVTIPIEVSPAALTETDDYTVTAQALTFAVGELSRTLTVTANEDADSADESVALGFGELPDGVGPGTTLTAVVALQRQRPAGGGR